MAVSENLEENFFARSLLFIVDQLRLLLPSTGGPFNMRGVIVAAEKKEEGGA